MVCRTFYLVTFVAHQTTSRYSKCATNLGEFVYIHRKKPYAIIRVDNICTSSILFDTVVYTNMRCPVYLDANNLGEFIYTHNTRFKMWELVSESPDGLWYRNWPTVYGTRIGNIERILSVRSEI